MPDDALLTGVLRRIEDPELGRSIVELGMLAGVDRHDGRVQVRLASLPEDSWPPDELEARIRAALLAEPGVDAVAFERRAMDEREAARAAAVLRGDPPPNPLAVVDAATEPPPRPPCRNPFTDATTRVLAVASGKGGVGKSSVSANLAVALAGVATGSGSSTRTCGASRCRACSASTTRRGSSTT